MADKTRKSFIYVSIEKLQLQETIESTKEFNGIVYFQVAASTFQQDGSSFRRKLSKREKKQLKKQEKLNRIKSNGANDENDARVAEKLYSGGYLAVTFA